jgi:uncharacterized protein (TIGR00661 family)
MARILYGVCGEGMGHASRSRILINYLKKQGHDIRIVAGSKAYDFLSKEFEFVYESEFPKVVYKNNEVALVHTLLRFFYRTIAYSISSFYKIRRVIKDFNPELLITDAEPISFFAAFFSKIKRISIDNPRVLLYRKYNVKLGEYVTWFFLTFAVKISTFNANKYFIYDFFDTQVDDEHVVFFKPLIQEGILQQNSKYGDYVFVYQTSVSHTSLFKVLKNIDEKFVIYGFNKDKVDENLTYKRFNEREFYHDISNAKAVITNGGFTVISEALYLKKPIFCLPIKYQFEQILNGRFLEQLGAGVSRLMVNEDDLRDFFNNLDIYKKKLKRYNPGDQDKTLKLIEQEIQAVLLSS